jgi:hypothetical protein
MKREEVTYRNASHFDSFFFIIVYCGGTTAVRPETERFLVKERALGCYEI